MNSYYIDDHRSKKWYHRIFLHLLEVAILNSYILYKRKIVKPLNLKEYRYVIIKGLIGNTRKRRNIPDSKE